MEIGNGFNRQFQFIIPFPHHFLGDCIFTIFIFSHFHIDSMLSNQTIKEITYSEFGEQVFNS